MAKKPKFKNEFLEPEKPAPQEPALPTAEVLEPLFFPSPPEKYPPTAGNGKPRDLDDPNQPKSPQPLDPALHDKAVQALMQIKWTDYIPHEPTAKQLAFLSLPHREAFFGGSAGGGKSDALLMASLMYVDVPGYSAILFRKTLSELKLPNSLLDRAHNWLAGKNCKWVASEHKYLFPTVLPDGTPGDPATIVFGYIGQESAKQRYQSAEFAFCGFDELTHHYEEDYVWMMSRLRKVACLTHKTDAQGKPIYDPLCPECRYKAAVPIRMRAASNPGSMGHCLPYGEVLTVSGWVPIQDVRVGDRVYTVTDKFKLELGSVSQVHAQQYHGDLVRLKTATFSMICTPNHKIPYLVKPFEKYTLREVDKLPGQATVLRMADWTGTSYGDFYLPEVHKGWVKHNQPRVLSAGTYAALMGWFLSEGHTVKRDKAFGISQTKEPYRSEIRSLLTFAGFTFSEVESGFLVYSPDWFHYLKQFGKCRTKFIPRKLLLASKAELSVLLMCLLAGDGYKASSPHGAVYYTISAQLADDVAELAFKVGYQVTLRSRQRKNRRGLSYEVSLAKSQMRGSEVLTGNHVYNVKTTVKRGKQSELVPHNGTVYCLGVDGTHTFVCRQDGYIFVSGNSWVQARFQISPEPDPTNPSEVIYLGHNKEAPFIPSFVKDNPYLDREAYELQLDQLDPLTRAQLKKGDWGASADARFKRQWFDARRFSRRGDYLTLGRNGSGLSFLPSQFQRIFVTVDPAASSKEGPGDTTNYRKLSHSYTVVAVFGLTHDYKLLWLDNHRVLVEIPDIIRLLKSVYRSWRPAYFIIEATGLGKGVFQLAQKVGLPVRAVYPHHDKVVRATDAMTRAEQGYIWLPEPPGPPWLKLLEDELFSWTGHPHQQDDQVDALSHAAHDVSWEASINEQAFDPELVGVTSSADHPGIIYGAGTYPGSIGMEPHIDRPLLQSVHPFSQY